MSKYWNELTRSLTPYVPGEQPKDQAYIKLNTNENPYPPSPRVLAAVAAANNEYLKLYPDPTGSELRDAIAAEVGLEQGNIFVGNGSDELLAFSFMAFFERSRPVLFPDITYSFYKVYAGLFRLQCGLIPLDADFEVPLDQFPAANGGIVLANPNAPTGKLIPLKSLQQLIADNREQVVIIDEAYIDFSGESAVALIPEHPNLLVIQTLSKSRSLAGLRIGFACGSRELIEGLERVKNSFNSYTLDRIALAAGSAAIRDRSYFEATVQKVIRTRTDTAAQLRALGFAVTDSKANFVFVSHPSIPAVHLQLELKKRGVLVRHFQLPRIDNHLRVSIGTDEEMAIFIKQVKAVLATYVGNSVSL